MDCYAPIKAQGSEPALIAEAIYTAATDGADRLRYPAGHDAITKIRNRKEWPEQDFLADMRSQFGIRETAPQQLTGEAVA